MDPKDIKEQVEEQVHEIVDEAKAEMLTLRDRLSSYKDKYWKHAISIVILLAFGTGVYFYSNYAARQKVEQFAAGLKDAWTQQNQPLLDNISQLQRQQEDLRKNFVTQKKELDALKAAKKKEWINVKSSKDPKVIAQYFDNVIDSYVPER